MKNSADHLNLSLAERHLREAEQQVSRQEQLIARLKAENASADEAEALLLKFRKVLVHFRRRLESEFEHRH